MKFHTHSAKYLHATSVSQIIYTQADAVPTSAATVGANGNFSSLTSYTAGTAGDLAGTVTSAGVLTVTAGGAGRDEVVRTAQHRALAVPLVLHRAAGVLQVSRCGPGWHCSIQVDQQRIAADPLDDARG